MVQKGLKMHEKRQKIEFLDLKKLFFSGFFLNGIGGYPPPPLTENHSAQKSLAEWGGTPHPQRKIIVPKKAQRNGGIAPLHQRKKIRLVVFESLPQRVAENHSKTHLQTIQISLPQVKFMEMWATMLNTAFFPKNVNSKAEQTAEIYLENLQKYLGRYPNSGPAFLTIMLSMFAATFARNCLFSNPVLQPRTFPAQLQTFNFPRERQRESWKA